MAISLNKVTIAGNLTADIEAKQTPSGVSVIKFSLAVHRRYSKEGQENQADFIKVVAWRQNADFLAKYARKGDNIVVSGELQNERWTDKAGQNRVDTVIVADYVQINNAKQTSEQGTPEITDNYDTPF